MQVTRASVIYREVPSERDSTWAIRCETVGLFRLIVSEAVMAVLPQVPRLFDTNAGFAAYQAAGRFGRGHEWFTVPVDRAKALTILQEAV